MAKKGLDVTWLRKIVPTLDIVIEALERRHGFTQSWTRMLASALAAEEHAEAARAAEQHAEAARATQAPQAASADTPSTQSSNA
jgi:hypothetical protein